MFCSARQQYIKKNFPTERLLASGRQLVTFEKTPNYASLPQVPELISKICPWAKVILMLRNPVDRAYSNYQMDKKLNKVSETFEELVRKEIQVMKKVKLTKVSADKIENWDIQDTTMDQLFNNPPSNMTQEELDHAHWSVYRQRHLRNYLQRGIYSDLLERWLKYFELGSTLMVINNERLHAEPRQVMKEVLRFLDSPKTDFFDDEKVSLVSTTPPGRKSMLLSVGGYNPMANNTRHFLEKFYNPYNQQIVGILGEEWKGVWNTSGRMNAG